MKARSRQTAAARTPGIPRLSPGTRVRITRRIVGRDGAWDVSVAGEVLRHDEEPTGSWFAGGRGDRLWLSRVRLRRDDGEITTVVLDGATRVDLVT